MLWMEPKPSRSTSVLAWDEEDREDPWDWQDRAEYLRSGGVDSRDRDDDEDEDAYEDDERGGSSSCLVGRSRL